MFIGNYNFFDYKYNIEGYHGQDFGGFAQYFYLGSSIFLLLFLLIMLRKIEKEKVLKIIRGIGIFLILFYIGKTTWESFYDIKRFGSFNTGLLPLDACSMIMLATLLAGYGTGKVKKMAECWIVTGGIVGGIATMVRLNAFQYYPFLSFGAFYSMIWHFLMVFLGLLLIVTNYVEFKYTTILSGFFFHLLFSMIVIPIDYLFNFDFMMYKELSGIPIFEGIAKTLIEKGFPFLNPILMLLLYFLAFHIVFLPAIGIKKIRRNKL